MKAFILTLLLCFSCTRYAEVSKDAIGIEISPVQMDISHLDEIEWNVGKKKEEKISQSITFIVDLPKIRADDLEYLIQHKNIDAWILRLIAVRGSEKQDIGSLYTLWRPKKIGRGDSSGAPTSVTFKVFYAAAYASMKFRSFRCPAFGHNKRIKAMSIDGENEDFSINIGQATSYAEKSHLVELTPSAFNGGNTLTGKYFVEIAAYDSRRRMIHSSFKRIPKYISVTNEAPIRVASCDGVHSEMQ